MNVSNSMGFIEGWFTFVGRGYLSSSEHCATQTQLTSDFKHCKFASLGNLQFYKSISFYPPNTADRKLLPEDSFFVKIIGIRARANTGRKKNFA